MVRILNGRVGFVPRRDYTPGQECFPLDAVNYRNTLWACLAQTTDVPSATSPNWTPMLSLATGLAPGGGLDVNEDGLIFVAPDGFSENLLKELMGRMRVPIWLEKVTDFYVNGATGNDDMTVNDGLSPATAWRTIQGGVNNIASTYFMDFNARLNVAAGTYDEDVVVPAYQGSRGMLIISGASSNSTIVDGSFTFGSSGEYFLANLTTRFAGRTSSGLPTTWMGVRVSVGITLQTDNVSVDGTTRTEIPSRYGFSAGGGLIQMRNNCLCVNSFNACLNAESSGHIMLLGDMSFNGVVSSGTVRANQFGQISFNAGVLGRNPVMSGNITGPRASLRLLSVLNTYGAGGMNAFPGSTAGSKDPGSQES